MLGRIFGDGGGGGKEITGTSVRTESNFNESGEEREGGLTRKANL